MNKITTFGDGKTRDFFFSFPFFTKNDIVIEVNSVPATGYGIFCFQSDNLNSDFPFIGGKVHFSRAPRTTDIVTIKRKLELNRHIDYQPSLRLNPTTVNQDMNFIIEILKDMRNVLVDFSEQYSEITDKESTKNLLTKITNVTTKIDTISNEIDNLGDIALINTNIENLNNSVNALNTSLASIETTITNLSSFKNDIADYVIETQAPTHNNDYKWYRKYKSGWIEQGGTVNGASTVTLPVAMTDTHYTVVATCRNTSTATPIGINIVNTSSFYINCGGYKTDWIVYGKIA